MPNITLTWNANPATDNIVDYEVWGANGTSVAFASCAKLASVNALTWTDTGLPANQPRTYYIRPVNEVGPASSPEGPLNITTAAASSVYVQNAGGTPTLQEGTHAARPAAGNPGALYLETDTLALYRDTGSAWTQVLGGGGGGGGATIPTLVQSAFVRTTNGTIGSASVTLGAAPTAGNLLVAITVGYASTGTYAYLSGWEKMADQQNTPSINQGLLVQARVVQAGDSATQTQTFSGNNGGQVFAVLEFSGWQGISAHAWAGTGITSGASAYVPTLRAVQTSYGIVIFEADNSNAYSSISNATLLFDGTGGGQNHPSVLAKPTSAGNVQITFTGTTFTTPLIAMIDVF